MDVDLQDSSELLLDIYIRSEISKYDCVYAKMTNKDVNVLIHSFFKKIYF